jgi:uncharacterized protein (DUF736 family)
MNKTYDNNKTVLLFPKENANPNAPKFKGKLTDENGKEWEISIWQKTSKAGNIFFSGDFKKPFVPSKKGDGYNSHNQSKANGYAPQREEEIPF